MADVAVHRVVIVGGGFGGLFAAKFLRRAHVEVTLVDAKNYHLFQPLLYQLATGILSEGEVAPPIRGSCAGTQRDRGDGHGDGSTSSRQDRDREAARPGRSHLRVRQPDRRGGRRQSFFGHDEFARFAPGMKTIDDALELRGRIFGAFEMAENEPRSRGASVVAHLRGRRWRSDRCRDRGSDRGAARFGLKGNFRRIDPAEARVVLVDGGKEILARSGTGCPGRPRDSYDGSA